MLQIDVIADLVCPWSYLGKKRLDDALSAVHGPSVVTWYPYQLNPNMPLSGQPFEEYLQSKYGPPDSLQPAMDQLVISGKAEGIDFRFDRITNVPNTLNAHRLMNLAESQSADTSSLAESILQVFSAGLDISKPDVLAEMGIRVGLGLNKILLASPASPHSAPAVSPAASNAHNLQ
jgi:predicted DsbA family dithiol-disulfide isomerase